MVILKEMRVSASMKKKWMLTTCLILTSLGFSAGTLPAQAASFSYQPDSGVLVQTQQGRQVQQQLLPFFAKPEKYAARWRSIQTYFSSRFEIADPQNYAFTPQIIVLHSTESEGVAGVYQTFAHSSESRYLGGVWTHFLVDQQGKIIQYSPLNRLSKGQAGANDIAVGIEILGTASTYQGNKALKTGSIARRYAAGQRTQLEAVADLTASLQAQFSIPARKIYSHQELALIGKLSGSEPDYNWLKKNISDRVYLGQVADLLPNGKPDRKYGYLEPYGRSDPGLDVVATVKGLLIQPAVSKPKGQSELTPF